MSDDFNKYKPATSDNFITRGLSEINCGILIYEADQRAEILYSNETLWSIFDCTYDAEFLLWVDGSARGLIHPIDREKVENIRRNQVHERQKHSKLSYRIKTKNGAIRYVDDYTCIYQDPEKGLVGVSYIFASNSQYDELTGLPSLQYFLDITNSTDSSSFKQGMTPVMLAFNLNRFKAYNLRYGRREGDSLLVSFANILSKHFDFEHCTRVDEDRFYVFSSVTDLEEKLKSVFDSLSHLNNGRSLSVRTGIYIYDPADYIFSSVACKYADIACDNNQDRQHSQYLCFDESMKETLQKQEYIFNTFNQALRQELIEVYYQPMVFVSTGKPYGFEAFSRWNDSHYGMLYPADFLPVLDKYHLTYKLDLYVIRKVAEAKHERKCRGQKTYPVSINLSATDFLSCDPCSELLAIIEEYELTPSDFHVEITESAISLDSGKLKSAIDRFHKNGFNVIVEYFGSENSSLSTFLHYEFDMVKLDRSFMRNFGERSKAIMHPIITMAKSLGIHTLAIGVETEEQASYLKLIGCELLQGFLYGRPLKLSDSVAMIDDLSKASVNPITEEISHEVYTSSDSAFHTLLKDSVSYKDSIFDILLSKYNSVHYLDLEADSYKEIISSYPVHKYLGDSGHNTVAAFSSVMKALAKPTYTGKILKFTNTATLAERLQYADHIHCDFEEVLYNWNMRAVFHVLARNKEGVATKVLFMTQKISADVSSEVLFTNVIHALENVYYAITFIALDTHEVTPIIMPDKMWERAGSQKTQPYEFLKNLYIENYVHKDFRDKVLHFSDIYSLPKRLTNRQYISLDYKSQDNKWRSFIYIPSRKNDDGTVTQVIMAIEDRDAEKNAQSVLEYQADHDAMTGLLNRAAYQNQKQRLMESSSPTAYVMIDANRFKDINDTYGHDIGDKVLKVIADNLKTAFRFTDLVIRLGGDEFCVILQDIKEDQVGALIEKLNSINEKISKPQGDFPGVTLSAGIALSEHGLTEELPKLADIAMYRAKHLPDTHVVLYNPSMF